MKVLAVDVGRYILAQQRKRGWGGDIFNVVEGIISGTLSGCDTAGGEIIVIIGFESGWGVGGGGCGGAGQWEEGGVIVSVHEGVVVEHIIRHPFMVNTSSRANTNIFSAHINRLEQIGWMMNEYGDEEKGKEMLDWRRIGARTDC